MKSVAGRRAQGFTIIEILIVLAIAGVILLIILLAVPAAQRNARNTLRRDAVDYIVGQLNEYYSNNGKYPLSGPNPSDDNRTSFVAGLTSGGLSKLFSVRYTDNGGSHEYPFGGAGSPSNPASAMDEISIEPAHRCNRDPSKQPGDTDYPLQSSAQGDSNYRAYAVWTQLENARVYCVDDEN